MQPLGIYLHIPFCESKCGYCDFYSMKADEQTLEAYTAALCRALQQSPAAGRRADTVYFGGGTPLLLGEKRLCRMLEAVDRTHPLTAGAEITTEANPHSALRSTLQTLHAGGFGRISFGLQTADDRLLRLLGRRHTAEDARRAVADARAAGFANLSLDLMLAIPDQRPEDLQHTVDFCRELSPEHLSAYLLKIEPGTPFAQQQMADRCPDEEAAGEFYLQCVQLLAAAGWQQYEISNFARPGFESRHNLKYWRCEEYLGVGPAAHSFLEGRRRYFPRDLSAFLAAEAPFALWQDDGEGGGCEETAMLRLRLTEGLDTARLTSRFPEADGAGILRRAEALQPHGLTRCCGSTVSLTPQGMLLSNAVTARLLFG